MDKKISRSIGIIMLFAAVGFVIFALNHPEMSWPWNNTITYILYLIYIVGMIVCFIAPLKKK